MSQNRFLFIDDFHISEIKDLKRTMNQVAKYGGNPVIRPDKPWECGMVAAKNSSIYDAQRRLFKIWYRIHGTCYAESEDGINWRKPNLGLVPFEGSMENNLIGKDIFQIVYEDEDHGMPLTDSQYSTVSWNHEMGNYLMTSRDGFYWSDGLKIKILGAGDTFVITKSKKQLSGLVTSGLPGYPKLKNMPKYLGVARWSKPVGRFDGSDSTHPVRRVQALMTSDDMMKWENPIRILTPDALDDAMAYERIDAALKDKSLIHLYEDDRRCEFYTLFIIPYEDWFIGLLVVFDPAYEFFRLGKNNQAGPGEVQLVASRDLVDWIRIGDRRPFIPRGNYGEFDWALAWYPSMPIVKDDKLWFFYTGSTMTHAGMQDKGYLAELVERVSSRELPAINSIGLATLRRDGFVSLDADSQPGFVLTKPFPWCENKELHLNADATNGEISVSLCQPDGSPFTGYMCSQMITGNHHDCKIKWHKSLDGGSSSRFYHATREEAGADNEMQDDEILRPGAMIRLKINARNAKLYSYWFK